MASKIASASTDNPGIGSTLSRTQKESYFGSLWQLALADCGEIIGQYDFQTIQQFEDPIALMASIEQNASAYSQKSLPLVNSLIQPCLKKLQVFSAILALSIGPTVSTAVIWGIINLLFEASRSSYNKLRTVFEMLDEMTFELSIIEEYKATFQKYPDLEEILVRAFALMIRFWAGVAQYLRKNPTENMADSVVNWMKSESGYESTRNELIRHVARLKQLVEARRANLPLEAELLKRMDRVQITPVHEKCHNLPVAENPNFCLRDNLMIDLRKALEHTSAQDETRYLTLFGEPGIGKSSVALAYAHERRRLGLKFIVWIRAETEIDRDSSFTEFAKKLGLPNTSVDGDHAKNRQEVVDWLERLDQDWLMILDNVEDPSIVRKCQISTKYGSVLLTCRAKSMVQGCTNNFLQVNRLSVDDGASLLIRLIDWPEAPSDEDWGAARSFAFEMDGLPLGLELIARRIIDTVDSIPNYLQSFKKNPVKLHQRYGKSIGFYYPSAMNVFADELYGSLTDSSCALLSAIAFMAPDNIPLALCKGLEKDALPASLSFCYDDDDFDEALAPLLRRGLVTREPGSPMVAIHRFIQDSHRAWLAEDQTTTAFHASAQLLCHAFPVHYGGGSLRNQWRACHLYVSHVLSLCSKFRMHRFVPGPKHDFTNFVKLLKSCGWYLLERGSWAEFIDLFEAANTACVDKNSIDWAHLCNTAGCVEYERGHVKASRPFMQQSLDIRKKLLPPLHLERSDAYNNYGNLLLTESLQPHSLDAALQMYQEAIAIDQVVPGADRILHIRYINLGAVYTWQKKYVEASDTYEMARAAAIKTFGPDCHFVGRVEYLRGRNFLLQGALNDAYEAFNKALKIFVQENDTHHGVAATDLKLAQIHLAREQPDKAIPLLRQALLICKLNEPGKGDQGDIARVSWHLGRALSMTAKDKDIEEAKRLRAFAISVMQNMRNVQFPDSISDDEKFDLMVFHGDR